MRYLIDETNLGPEGSLAVYRLTVGWAAARGDRFVMLLERGVYDDPAELSRYTGLGKNLPTDDPRLVDLIRVEGELSTSVVRELTRTGAPARAISGDVCPALQVTILVCDRTLYGCYDYGRTQMLDITNDELEDAKRTLVSGGLDPGVLTPAPRYVTDRR